MVICQYPVIIFHSVIYGWKEENVPKDYVYCLITLLSNVITREHTNVRDLYQKLRTVCQGHPNYDADITGGSHDNYLPISYHNKFSWGTTFPL